MNNGPEKHSMPLLFREQENSRIRLRQDHFLINNINCWSNLHALRALNEMGIDESLHANWSTLYHTVNANKHILIKFLFKFLFYQTRIFGAFDLTLKLSKSSVIVKTDEFTVSDVCQFTNSNPMVVFFRSSEKLGLDLVGGGVLYVMKRCS